MLGVVTLVFFVAHLIPGDPSEFITEHSLDQAGRDLVRQRLGLDRPLLEQYGHWLQSVVRGDLGVSLRQQRPVAQIIGAAWRNTLVLSGLALLLELTVGVAVGVLMANRPTSRRATVFNLGGLALHSLPSFWLGLVAITLFARNLGWLPAGGMHAADAAWMPWGARTLDTLRHLVLPVLILGLGNYAVTARLTRASLARVLADDVGAGRARARRAGAAPGLASCPAGGVAARADLDGRQRAAAGGWCGGRGRGVRLAGAGADHRAGPAGPRLSGDHGQHPGGGGDGGAGLAAGRSGGASGRPASAPGRPTPGGAVMRRDLRVGLVLAVLGLVITLGAGVLRPGDPTAMGPVGQSLQAPSWGHPLGTDSLGRDVLQRVLHGGRMSLLVGWSTTLAATLLGTMVGLAAGLAWRPLRLLLTYIIDLFMAFPAVYLVLLLVAVTRPSLWLLVLVLAVSSWMDVARLVRAESMALRDREFVAAARGLGLGSWRVALRHVVPNLMPTVMVAGALRIGHVILMESFLSFLGLGPQEPLVSWGAMVAQGRANLLDAWWLTLFPGLAITVTVLAYNLLADGLRARIWPEGRGEGSGHGAA